MKCGFTLQIDQSVKKQWPLNLLDLNGNKQKIYLEPGEMLIYEGAKVLHGRQEPLDGEFFDNLFIHFHPKHNLQLRRFVSVFLKQRSQKSALLLDDDNCHFKS